jgi:hypothetical protein
MPPKKVTFDPEGPLWDTSFSGMRYPTYLCAFCDGGFDEREGKGVAWLSKDSILCCSETCARLYLPREEPRFRIIDN